MWDSEILIHEERQFRRCYHELPEFVRAMVSDYSSNEIWQFAGTVIREATKTMHYAVFEKKSQMLHELFGLKHTVDPREKLWFEHVPQVYDN